jgi:hypothetical protein
VTIWVVEVRKKDRRCKTILRIIGEAQDIQLLPVKILGWQTCGWRCGYFAFFCSWYAANNPGTSLQTMPLAKMPRSFPQLVWSILEGKRENTAVIIGEQQQQQALASQATVEFHSLESPSPKKSTSAIAKRTRNAKRSAQGNQLQGGIASRLRSRED